MGMLDGKVVLVTGSGRGIGRDFALAMAAAGARVVVNDLGSSTDGTDIEGTPAEEVVKEITAAGGEAVANFGSVSDPDQARDMVQQAIDNLEQGDVVELDEERKAQMVSNLLVVLCSERGTQPVINAGTIYG